MTVVGGMRPPAPITVTAGSGFPLDSFVTPRPGEATSVIERLLNALEVGRHDGVQPGRNSATVPRTCTRSPTETAFATDDPNTRMPSDVAGSASGVGSCSQTFEPRFAITTPSTSTS